MPSKAHARRASPTAEVFGRRASAQDPSLARLAAIAGPAAGRQFFLDGDELTIGRAVDNAICIYDTSVSRKHVLLRRVDAGWAASDMGSGNGTLVNDEAIAELTPLCDGDVLTLGDSQLLFNEPGLTTGDRLARREEPAPVRARERDTRATPSRRRWPVVLAFISTVAVAGGAAYWLRLNALEKEREQARAQQRALADQCEVIMRRAKQLVHDGKWADAKVDLLAARELLPDFENGSPQRYLDAVEKELPIQQTLDAAASALAEHQLAKTAAALKTVPEATQQHERAEQLRAQLSREITAAVARGRELLADPTDKAKMELVVATAADVLAADADQREAQEQQLAAQAALERQSRPVVCEFGTAANGTCKAAPRPGLEVQRRFRSGDADGAAARAEACAKTSAECRTLKSQLKQFAASYRKLDTLSPSELKSLLQLDKKLGGGENSPAARLIGVRLSAAFVKKASDCRAKGDMGCAADNAQVALEGAPQPPEAKQIAAESATKTKERYFECYALSGSDPDEAKQCFQRFVQTTSPKSEWYQKAKLRLSPH